ncbi:hypothetical protein PFISCL1PPCAC_14350, partial [Pristionchus fissidentatus]
DLLYGLHWDRDYFVDVVFRVQAILPIICIFTVYPANLYLLLVESPAMNRTIRAAYIANLIAHIFCDFIFSVLLRVYAFPPYGLFYCEGILCGDGANKQIIIVL